MCCGLQITQDTYLTESYGIIKNTYTDELSWRQVDLFPNFKYICVIYLWKSSARDVFSHDDWDAAVRYECIVAQKLFLPPSNCYQDDGTVIIRYMHPHLEIDLSLHSLLFLLIPKLLH